MLGELEKAPLTDCSWKDRFADIECVFNDLLGIDMEVASYLYTEVRREEITIVILCPPEGPFLLLHFLSACINSR